MNKQQRDNIAETIVVLVLAVAALSLCIVLLSWAVGYAVR